MEYAEYVPYAIATGAVLNALLPTHVMGKLGKAIEFLALAIGQGRNR